MANEISKSVIDHVCQQFRCIITLKNLIGHYLDFLGFLYNLHQPLTRATYRNLAQGEGGDKLLNFFRGFMPRGFLRYKQETIIYCTFGIESLAKYL